MDQDECVLICQYIWLTSLFQLRLMYEGNPMAFIVEQAGGKAITGRQRILDIVPKEIHERCPVFMGSSEDVQDVEELYKKYAA